MNILALGESTWFSQKFLGIEKPSAVKELQSTKCKLQVGTHVKVYSLTNGLRIRKYIGPAKPGSSICEFRDRDGLKSYGVLFDSKEPKAFQLPLTEGMEELSFEELKKILEQRLERLWERERKSKEALSDSLGSQSVTIDNNTPQIASN